MIFDRNQVKDKGMRSIVFYKSLLILAFIMAASVSTIGQDTLNRVRYTPDFRFNDGIFLNFDQVKYNRPIPKAKILTSADYNDREFFTKVFASDNFYFYDEVGVRQEVAKNDIWGFARNGVLYVMIQGNFSRVTFIGQICHFVADVTTYDTRYNNYSPYNYYDPYYYSPYSYYGGYPYGGYNYPYNQSTTARTELKQYIIDFESDKVMEFSLENVEVVLMRDPAIYEEFMKMSKKMRKQMMFVYIRKFNEKNPLYLPSK